MGELSEFLSVLIGMHPCITKQSRVEMVAIAKRLEQETEAKIHHIKTQAARISDDVVLLLLKHVTAVKN